MNFKKNWKRFCDLSSAREGFTLVELIVVIAILAILAGVAVPAYSGYVKKAERAADEALLNAINTAFASACAINGESHIGRNDVPDHDVSSGTFAYAGPFEDSFNGFYEGGEFKTFTDLYYNKAIGGFAENYDISVTYNGQTITVSSKDLATLTNSNLGAIGAETLLTQMDTLSVWADAFNLAGMSGTGFASAMMDYLGVESPEELSEVMSAYGEDANKITANALVLYAAQNSTGMTANDLTTLLSSSDIVSELTNASNAAGLAQAGAIYGLYLAYNSDAEINWDDPTVVLNAAAGDSEFSTWLNSTSGQSELDAYLSAMNIISGSASDSNTTTELLENGYADADLIALMQSLMGN